MFVLQDPASLHLNILSSNLAVISFTNDAMPLHNHSKWLSLYWLFVEKFQTDDLQIFWCLFWSNMRPPFLQKFTTENMLGDMAVIHSCYIAQPPYSSTVECCHQWWKLSTHVKIGYFVLSFRKSLLLYKGSKYVYSVHVSVLCMHKRVPSHKSCIVSKHKVPD